MINFILMLMMIILSPVLIVCALISVILIGCVVYSVVVMVTESIRKLINNK